MDPRCLSATGYGQYRPIAPNDSEANMVRNRRVDIVVLKEAYNVSEPQENCHSKKFKADNVWLQGNP
ncbi:MAG: chemotaxis protein MotB [Clostridia bacterium]|nr:chemotaxis protein MotB [Clostridia bacterium]